MTKPVLADPRRSGTTSGLSFASSTGAGLEIPVLFQLADQSQFKVLTPPARPTPELKTTPPDRCHAADSLPATATSSQPLARDAAESSAASAAPSTTTATAASKPLTGPTAPTADSGLLAGVADAAEPAAAPLADSPTIRERAQLRQWRQAAAKGDWFQSQGKYILVIFLIALGGTIYMARLGDDSPTPPVPHTGVLAGDAAAPVPVSPTTVAPSEESPLADSDASPPSGPNPAATTAGTAADGVAETNPAADPALTAPTADDPLAAFPAGEQSPQVNLEAPIARQEESPVAPSPDESLFPWANQEQRVASRPQPETAPSSVPMPRSNPHYQPRPRAAGAAAPSQPPTMGSPQLTVPAAAAEQPAAAVYPVTDPATYRNFQLESRWPAPSGAAPATYENRVPTAPRTSGPRYERTGSGLY